MDCQRCCLAPVAPGQNLCPQCAQIERQERKDRATLIHRIWTGAAKPDPDSRDKFPVPSIAHHGATWGTLSAALQSHLASFVDGAEGFAIFAGPTGTGKSYTAWAVIHRLVVQGVRVERVRWSRLATLADKCTQFGQIGSDAETELARLARVPVLVVEDLGVIAPSERAMGYLWDLIDERHEAQRRMLFTTNLGRADLIEKLSEPMVDRLFSGIVQEFQGQNRRAVHK